MTILFSACKDPCPETTQKKFDGKYVKGTIISVPNMNQYGFVEIDNDHASSSLSLYQYSELSTAQLYEEYYFKVEDRSSVPFATDFSKTAPSEKEQYDGANLSTAIDYHSFEEHGQGAPFHRLGHIWADSFVETPRIAGATVSYSLKIRGLEGRGNSDKAFDVKKHLLEKARSFGPGPIWVKSEKGNRNIIIDIDTCHMHGDRQITCRSDL